MHAIMVPISKQPANPETNININGFELSASI